MTSVEPPAAHIKTDIKFLDIRFSDTNPCKCIRYCHSVNFLKNLFYNYFKINKSCIIINSLIFHLIKKWKWTKKSSVSWKPHSLIVTNIDNFFLSCQILEANNDYLSDYSLWRLPFASIKWETLSSVLWWSDPRIGNLRIRTI